MLGSRLTVLLVCLGVLTGGAAAGADPRRPIPASELAVAPEPVAAWDPASPQRLVRIDGALYQDERGLYFRVIENEVSVRLAEGVRDWSDLLERLRLASPVDFAALATLVPLRQNRLGIVDLELPAGAPDAWAARIHHTGLVRYAEVATWGVYDASPNDTHYTKQWALKNTGQTGGTPGADVDAEAAWEISKGDPAIVVGVLDSGTDIDHVDLAANTWINEDENPTNGVDDDGNGFIDDWAGWDFVGNNNNPKGSFFHGTHVTGIINAVGNNGQGVVGLAGGVGSPGVRAMAVQLGIDAPVGSIIDDSILYAVNNGARVITLSLSAGPSAAINDALDYAYNEQDVFIDCASGNNGPSVNYPANRPEVMAVAATTHNDVKASYSNPGPEVQIAAPGSNIWSTQLNNSYGSSDGTSFAAPHVGALAALIRGLNPSLTAPAVRQLIMDTADDVGPAGYDTGTGWGRINAFTALSQAGSPDGVVELDTTLYSCAGSLGIRVTDFDLVGQGTLAVTALSTREPGGESVVLSEVETAVFEGTIALDAGSVAADGKLQVIDGSLVIAKYIDADDGHGGINVAKTDTAATDCAGPGISAVSVTNVDADSATIGWTTDEPGTSLVRYGTAAPPDQDTGTGALVTGHTVNLSGLTPCTHYKFSVESEDALGNTAADDQGGQYYAFQTPGVGPCHAGQAQLDRFVYGCSGSAVATVTDVDLDLDPQAPNTVEVLVTSTTEPLGESLSLTETGPQTGTFQGAIALAAVAAAPDGILAVSAGDLVTLSYGDADDGEGQSHVASADATLDCTPPAFQNVRVTTLSSTRAVIEWTTSEPATSRVEFGTGLLLSQVVEDTALVTSHALAISPFEACERAYFRVRGDDAYGASGVADAAGEPFAFNLDRIGGLVFHDNFESDSGFALDGEWTRGVPQGQGSGSGDPLAAFSGASVLGTDLAGEGQFPGDYEPNASQTAYTPVLSSIGIFDLELIVKRKLGLASGDSASIVLNKGLTQTVWSTSAPTDDPDWVEVRYPIPGADDRDAFRIGFRIVAGFAAQSYGFNLDEIIVKDSNEPDYLTCGGCAGTPTFAGLSKAYDPAPCAPSSLVLEWQPAPAWGTGSGGTYEVYRGTTADFLPDGTNLVAAGLVGTSWIDTTAPADTALWYVVRARNNESCGGGAGLVEGNLVRREAMQTTVPPVPPALGPTLQATAVGGVHVQLDWQAVPGADHYVVRRSAFPNFALAQVIGTTSDTAFVDQGTLGNGLDAYYRVFPANACGVEAP